MGARIQGWWIALREWLVTGWPLALVALVGFWVAFQFVEPAPPRQLTISTGSEDGAYYNFAKRYQDILAKEGIRLDILTSAGSSENMERLNRDEAQVAFVQGGGMPESEQGEESGLLSLGSVFYEPVWVFVRSHVGGRKRLPTRLTDLEGWRIAVGQEGSGVKALAGRLLEANEMEGVGQPLVSLGGLQAAEELQQGRLDALFVIAAPEAPVVQVLLRSPGIRLMSFSQAEAYKLRFPFLSRLTLPKGAVDLTRNTPPRDTELLAATANLVVRDDLHPVLRSLLLKAMRQVHGGSSFFNVRGEFPAYKDTSLPLAEEAERYYTSGPPFLQRYLPFWLAVLVDRFLVLALPLFALLFPLMRVAPALYSWRIRSRICRCYGELKFLENDIKVHYDQGEHDMTALAALRQRLDEIEATANSLSIPLSFSDLLYTLREHINLVRKTLDRRERELEAAHLQQNGLNS